MAPVTPRAPVEAKTQAAGTAGIVAGAIIWLLQEYVFKGTVNPGVVSLVYAAVPGVLAFAAAYVAPHTPRPVAAPPAGVPPTGTVTVTRPSVTTTTPAPLPPPTGDQL